MNKFIELEKPYIRTLEEEFHFAKKHGNRNKDLLLIQEDGTRYLGERPREWPEGTYIAYSKQSGTNYSVYILNNEDLLFIGRWNKLPKTIQISIPKIRITNEKLPQ